MDEAGRGPGADAGATPGADAGLGDADPESHLGRPRRFTEDEVEQALLRTGGIYTAAANGLQRAEEQAGRFLPGMARVSRQLVAAYVERSDRLKAAAKEAVEATLDIAEGALVTKLAAGDVHAIRFYLEMKGASRGFARTRVVTGKNGGPIEANVTFRRHGADAKP